jgi:hypothetical protein
MDYLQLPSDAKILSFDSHEYLTVSEISNFMYDLNVTYDSLNYFHSLLDEKGETLDLLEEQKLYYTRLPSKSPSTTLASIVRKEISYAKRKLSTIILRLPDPDVKSKFYFPSQGYTPTLYTLQVFRLSLNSPGDYGFLGGLNPINSLIEGYKTYKEEKRKDEEFSHQKHIDEKNMKQKEEMHDLEKQKAEQEMILRSQDIVLKNLDIAQKTAGILAERGYQPSEINEVIEKLLDKPIKKLAKTHTKFRLKE